MADHTLRRTIARVPRSLLGDNPGKRSRPKMLSVELTNRCNLNCPFWLAGLQSQLQSTERDLLPPDGLFMDLELYENIVVDAAALVVSLFGVDDIRSYNVVNHALIVQMWSVRPRPGEFRRRPSLASSRSVLTGQVKLIPLRNNPSLAPGYGLFLVHSDSDGLFQIYTSDREH